MRRALIVKTTSMGDVIHALPAVADLARAQPDLTIDWVVEKSFADIPRLSRYVSDVHEVSVRQWRKNIFNAQTWKDVGAVRLALQSAHYERVVDLQGLLKSAVIGRWAQSFLMGYNKNSIKEPWASRFYDKTYAVSKKLSAVTRCRMLLGAAFDYDYQQYPLDFGLKPPVAEVSSTASASPAADMTFQLALPEESLHAYTFALSKSTLPITILLSVISGSGLSETLQRANCNRESLYGREERRLSAPATCETSSPSSILMVKRGNVEKNATSTLPTFTSALRYVLAAFSTIGVSLDGVSTNHSTTATATIQSPSSEPTDIRLTFSAFFSPGLITV